MSIFDKRAVSLVSVITVLSVLYVGQPLWALSGRHFILQYYMEGTTVWNEILMVGADVSASVLCVTLQGMHHCHQSTVSLLCINGSGCLILLYLPVMWTLGKATRENTVLCSYTSL